jgi:hypothetical protein|nr:MAG TPA: hypothetical protein [Caudoviricetes sp.]
MKGTISKTVVTTLLEVTRYNEETKSEETVTRKFMTLRTPSHERIEKYLMEEDKGYLSFKVISTEEEVYTMSAVDFINNAVKKER